MISKLLSSRSNSHTTSFSTSCSPRFVRAHLTRSIECKTKPGIIIQSFVPGSVDFDSLHNNAPTAIEIDEPLKTLLYATGDMGSCNGLHCLYNLRSDLFLWNPAMRKCRKLPAAPAEFLRLFEFDKSSLGGFGYDAGNDDYSYSYSFATLCQ
ncbi:hypothetical protein POM88_042725 [Heracleum sosnowskyi]|uniref:Uncharacterized protein n=1 Tax=Heracleum sosnowskyi TaxID=360622 RepID=A0AAD8HH66_9APIA|nr:hypothetical protein POM88_042725 [Heracleum sosnowskyi]